MQFLRDVFPARHLPAEVVLSMGRLLLQDLRTLEAHCPGLRHRAGRGGASRIVRDRFPAMPRGRLRARDRIRLAMLPWECQEIGPPGARNLQDW